MAKFLKVILFLVLATAFGGSVSDVSAVPMADEPVCESYVPASRCPHWADAELAGAGGVTQLLTCSRVQRSHTTEYLLSLKEVAARLVHRAGAWSLHRSKLFTSSLSYRCHPVCGYYVFALRRIII